MRILVDTHILIWLLNGTLLVSRLPFHHKDPFDRMIIAQAMVEGVPIMSTDRDFADYGVDLL